MNNENLVIYDFKILYEILNEISDHINFKLTNINKITDLDLKAQDNYLVISNKKIKDIENQIEITNFPIDVVKLVEKLLNKNANIKLVSKNCDWIIANDISKKKSGFDSDYNEVTIHYKSPKFEKEKLSLKKKSEISEEIVDRIVAQIN